MWRDIRRPGAASFMPLVQPICATCMMDALIWICLCNGQSGILCITKNYDENWEYQLSSASKIQRIEIAPTGQRRPVLSSNLQTWAGPKLGGRIRVDVWMFLWNAVVILEIRTSFFILRSHLPLLQEDQACTSGSTCSASTASACYNLVGVVSP